MPISAKSAYSFATCYIQSHVCAGGVAVTLVSEVRGGRYKELAIFRGGCGPTGDALPGEAGMNLALLAVCALVVVAFLWRQYGVEEKAFRRASSAVKYFVTVLALLPIVMLFVSLWNVVMP
ncbi:MAG: hypothetical protein IAG10_34110 [Planctomycetaceae bacterium]|nr:hypothetical protein [Planctomycetaceae bacterium]